MRLAHFKGESSLRAVWLMNGLSKSVERTTSVRVHIPKALWYGGACVAVIVLMLGLMAAMVAAAAAARLDSGLSHRLTVQARVLL